ncbi:hypothetical protein CC80DRAFT_535004 [Byssothecium circinans]|uniref:Rhodopsin domain-containing protein n=1 Tax=Byssothecium circinans TaxID=147558 RepID=A0A6A5TVW2_9PLEO|nr:hypothetical protein CC80DRAFT_535004 [Byssothecium circinans]
MDDPQEALRHVALRGLRLRQSGAAGAMPNFPPGYLEETRAPQILIGNVLLQTIGTLFVLARAYCRIFLIGSWKSEDWALIIAWVCATVYSVCQYGQVAHGAGRHLASLSDPNDAITSQKYAFVAQVILLEALALPKLSICLSYLRIFYSDKLGRRLIQVLMVLVVCAMVPFFIESFFQCKPLHLYWTELRPSEKCLKDLPALYVSGTLNAAVDVALMAILIPRILELKLNTRQKVALIGIVCLGSVAVVAAIMRMVIVGSTLGRPQHASDGPWDTYEVSIWTSTEIYISLVCASALGMKPLILKVLPHILGTTLRSHSRATGKATTNPIELSSKMKRSTIGTRTFGTGLTATHGNYAEFGRGIDEESLGDKSDKSDSGGRHVRIADNRIMKKSEVTIERSCLNS